MDGPMEDTESVCLPIEEKVPVLLLNDVAFVLEKAIEGNCVTVVVVVVVVVILVCVVVDVVVGAVVVVVVVVGALVFSFGNDS